MSGRNDYPVFIQWNEEGTSCIVHLNDGTESEKLDSKEAALDYIQLAYSCDYMNKQTKNKLFDEILKDKDILDTKHEAMTKWVSVTMRN